MHSVLYLYQLQNVSYFSYVHFHEQRRGYETHMGTVHKVSAGFQEICTSDDLFPTIL